MKPKVDNVYLAKNPALNPERGEWTWQFLIVAKFTSSASEEFFVGIKNKVDPGSLYQAVFDSYGIEIGFLQETPFPLVSKIKRETSL